MCVCVCVCVYVQIEVFLNTLSHLDSPPFLIAAAEAPWSQPTSKSKTAAEAHLCPHEHSRINRVLAECPLQLFHSLSALPSASPEISFEKARAGPQRCIAVLFAGCRGFLLGLARVAGNSGITQKRFCITNLLALMETAPPTQLARARRRIQTSR